MQRLAIVLGVVAMVTCGCGVPRGSVVSPTTTRTTAQETSTVWIWKKLNSINPPPPRIAPHLSYDVTTSQFLLFGGFIETASPNRQSEKMTTLSDTWVWTSNSWTRVAVRVHPTGGCGSMADVMAYDPARSEIILVTPGGTEVSGCRSSTWGWTGSSWVKVLPSGPAWASDVASMVFDNATGQLLFVGHGTWSFGKGGWKEVAMMDASYFSMAYDLSSKEVVGTSSVDGDMWSWNGLRWHTVREGPFFDDEPNAVRVTQGPVGGAMATDMATKSVVELGDYPEGPIPSGDPVHLFIWYSDAWHPQAANVNLASDNPSYFAVADAPTLGGVVVFGGDSGVPSGIGDEISGGNGWWLLTA